MLSSSICIMLGSSVLGGVGWWIGNFFGLPAALVISTVASFYGMYLGWKFNREYFE